MPAKFELIAPCFFGCESTANFELRRIGAEDIRVSDGRLTFKGGADMIAAANLNLRTVERVMLLLNTYTATTFDELFDGVYSIHWEELLPADAAFPVTGSSLNSQLSSVPACQSIIKKAVVKRLMQGHRTTSLPETGAEYKIRFMLRKNVCEIMLDTTGDGLHKRGYRRNSMEAPIRETLAATIADLGRVRRDSLVEDPFCGSGTLDGAHALAVRGVGQDDGLAFGGEIGHVGHLEVAALLHAGQLGVGVGQSHGGGVDVVAEGLKAHVQLGVGQSLLALLGPDGGRHEAVALGGKAALEAGYPFCCLYFP